MGCGSSSGKKDYKSDDKKTEPVEDKKEKVAVVPAENKGEMNDLAYLNETDAQRLSEDVKKVEADGKEVANERAARKKGNHNDIMAHYKEKKKGKSNIIFAHAGVDVFKEEAGFRHIELNVIYDHLSKYMTEHKLDKIDSDTFLAQCLVMELFVGQTKMAQRLFTVLDSSRDGFLDLGELVTGMSVFARGTKAEKFKVCFKAYDIDGDGGVTKGEMANLLKSYISASLKAVSSAIEFETEMNEALAAGDGDEAKLEAKGEGYELKDEGAQEALTIDTPIGPITMHVNKKEVQDEEKDPFVRLHGDDFLTSMVDDIFTKYDKTKDQIIQFEEFETFVREHTALTEWFEFLEPDSDHVDTSI